MLVLSLPLLPLHGPGITPIAEKGIHGKAWECNALAHHSGGFRSDGHFNKITQVTEKSWKSRKFESDPGKSGKPRKCMAIMTNLKPNLVKSRNARETWESTEFFSYQGIAPS